MNKYFYYNFKTEMYEELETAPSDWEAYIPQYPPALNLYRLYLEMGKSSQDAALEVLLACAGENKQ